MPRGETVGTPLSFLASNGQLGPNAYEILAFFARASTLAMGAIGAPGDTFENVPLTSLGYSSSMPGGSGSSNHSFQFYYDAAVTHPFWNAIVSYAS